MNLFSFLPSFRSRKPKREARKLGGKRALQAQLQLESLEDRLVMAASVISGFVYADANNNGLFDPGEKPIANSNIQLRNSKGVVIGQTVTDANGFYQFNTDSTISTAPAILARSATIPTTSTDWTQSLSVGQFNPSLGTLTSIDIVNAGTFTSSFKVESLDGGPSTIVATVSGTVTLTGLGVSGLVASGASSKSFSASAFDGTIDFGGTSGHDFGSPATSGSSRITLSNPASLAAYTGLGSVTLSDTAHATSSASGAGNLLTQIGSTANAQVSVVYHFIPSNAIKPGNYVVVQTDEPPGYLDGKESSGGVVLPNSIGADSIPIVFSGSTSTGNDFGELVPGPVKPDSQQFQPINVNLTFLSKLQLLSNSQQIQQQATQLAYYIDGVYTVTLGRHADQDGLSYFTLQLLRGMTRQAFVMYMMSTPEHMMSEINSSYQSILGRSADAGGMNYFMGLLNSGVSINDINAGLLASSEFQAKFPIDAAYVQGVYQTLLGRLPNAPDQAYWQGQLAAGQSRLMVAERILHSSESIAQNLKQDYLNILGRNADPASLNQWVTMIQNGQTTEAQVVTALMCSDEFFMRVLVAGHLI